MQIDDMHSTGGTCQEFGQLQSSAVGWSWPVAPHALMHGIHSCFGPPAGHPCGKADCLWRVRSLVLTANLRQGMSLLRRGQFRLVVGPGSLVRGFLTIHIGLVWS